MASPIPGKLVTIDLHKNFAFALGSFEFIDAKKLALFSGLLYCLIGTFLFFLVFFVLKSKKYSKVNWPLGCLLVGVSGNAIDKIFNGFVTDFLIFELPFLNQSVINIADIYFLIGVISLVVIILFQSANIWYEGNRRKVIMVDHSFQKEFGIKLMFIALISTFFANIITIMVFNFLKVNISHSIIFISLLVQFIFLIFLCFTTYLFGLLESHKTSGALFSYKRSLKAALSQSKTHDFKLREGDYHVEILTDCMDQVSDYIDANATKNSHLSSGSDS